MIVDGERQVAPTLEGIRRDHTARYEWAARKLKPRAGVIDAACGIGYGSFILAEARHAVLGVDLSQSAIDYGQHFYPHEGVFRSCGDLTQAEFPACDAVVSFETIEHVKDPATVLRKFHEAAPLLFASVPNEDVLPFHKGFSYHFRHYTREEFTELLDSCGWTPIEWWGQAGPESEVERDVNGQTLIAVCERKQNKKAEPVAPAETNEHVVRTMESFDLGVPEHVAILGLGPSLEQYVDITKRLGGKHAFCDETWGINAVAGTLQCERVFHMDDVRIQMKRAEASPASNIARMVEWLRVHPGPVVTSRAHEDFPGLVEFPLERAINEFGVAYWNSTAAYAVCYAVLLGVKRISLFGCDFTYPNAHDAERGRACVEYWLGIARARGIKVAVANSSTLLDACHTQEERVYGYDTYDVTIRDVDGRAEVDLVPRTMLPTAEEIEAKYDHSRHPNEIVRQEREAS